MTGFNSSYIQHIHVYKYVVASSYIFQFVFLPSGAKARWIICLCRNKAVTSNLDGFWIYAWLSKRVNSTRDDSSHHHVHHHLRYTNQCKKKRTLEALEFLLLGNTFSLLIGLWKPRISFIFGIELPSRAIWYECVCLLDIYVISSSVTSTYPVFHLST